MSRGFQHRPTHPERRPRRQHVIHQHHLAPRPLVGAPLIHVGQGVKTGRAGGGRERGTVSKPPNQIGSKLTAPPHGQPLRHGLGRVEPTSPPPTPMQGYRHKHTPGRRGSPPLGHPLAQGAALPREPPVLHAVQNIVRAAAQPKPHPKPLASRTFPRQDLRRHVGRKCRPRPPARGANPRHLVGHQRVAALPTPSQAPPPVHEPKLADVGQRFRQDFILEAAEFACVGRCRFGG